MSAPAKPLPPCARAYAATGAGASAARRQEDLHATEGAQRPVKALGLVLDGAPAPSPAYKNLSKRQSALTAEQCQTMINGALLALVHKEGGKLVVATQDIFDAHAALGTRAVMVSDDDAHVIVMGMKSQ